MCGGGELQSARSELEVRSLCWELCAETLHSFSSLASASHEDRVFGAQYAVGISVATGGDPGGVEEVVTVRLKR